ncbi:bifunctional adenosylcobinamide kinase/adenosylcobinamide-phosphate guanylyltransferase [Paenibacillaceae bacterium]|nr:bifunctional adenosylcobinamide kinase/adenosylcobinamide-phosphate guanylyltransferase [Paenibacillaceae bacterium]
MAILVTGGARSGKSTFAEKYASRLGKSGIYIATLQPFDEEMTARTSEHQLARTASGFEWETIEEPLELVACLEQLAGSENATEVTEQVGDQEYAEDQTLAESEPVVLVDCLTIWLSNMMMQIELDNGGWGAEETACLEGWTSLLADTAAQLPFPAIFVTNEVGSGIVPEYPLGRRFRDAQGRLNQKMAAHCEQVFLVTAGIPVELKSIAYRWE